MYGQLLHGYISNVPKITLNQIYLFSNPILSLDKHLFVPNSTIFPTGASC